MKKKNKHDEKNYFKDVQQVEFLKQVYIILYYFLMMKTEGNTSAISEEKRTPGIPR